MYVVDNGFWSLKVLKYVYVCIWDVMAIVFCLYCEAWSCRCSCIGYGTVSSCRCMFVSFVHPVEVLNAVLCMTCSLLMLVEDERGNDIEEAYSRGGLMTAL